MNWNRFCRALGASLLLGACVMSARGADAPEPAQTETNAGTTLSEVTVNASAPADPGVPPVKERYDLPQTTASIASDVMEERINVVDTEDAVKYMPSLFVRKRNFGDTQPTLATRTWGVNSSARSLVYGDDVLLSALVANNNTMGAPRWGMVSPDQIERVDFLYGPFAAQYPGNSMGGVLLITTKMPDKPTLDMSQTEAFQDFSLYGTKGTYQTDQSNVVFGDKNGPVSWLVSENFQNSYSQPLTFITSATIPAGTTGAYAAQNKLGAAANVLGAGGLLHTQMNDISGKAQWDVSPEVKATYQIDFWNNDAQSTAQSYLHTAAGTPTFGGASGFAGSNYTLDQSHLANSISLKTDTKDTFDWEVVASNYYYLEDIQRNPFGVTGGSFTPYGTITRMDGTEWSNGDVKGIYRPDFFDGTHEVSFGVHADQYSLDNPVYGTSSWNTGSDSGNALYTSSEGSTMTQALWAQDAWSFAPKLKLTYGGRLEFWEASNGYNFSSRQNTLGVVTSSTAQNQPGIEDVRFSPKVSLDWTPSDEWELTSSFGQGYRFPTVTELYQIVSTGTTFATPNPNLKPENVLSEEVSLQRKFKDGSVRLSFFNENVFDALISQTGYLPGAGQTPYTYTSNVDSIRNTGVELAVQKDNVVKGVDVFGSVTYVDSEILSDPSFASSTGTTAAGKRVPYVPDWRATVGVTYHPVKRLALTSALRYSGRQYSTLDNTDNTENVFGAFDSFFVVDVRAEYKITDQLSAAFGIDNLNNDKYYLYHPFPQRTYSAQVKLAF
ncbi:MAG: TonB-dependent receptor [Verrucomicrobium sp.]|nr:TonB-dependent receptor [Verrucomicrobium sp.]